MLSKCITWKQNVLLGCSQQTTCKGAVTSISIISRMLSIHLSCLKAHAIPKPIAFGPFRTYPPRMFIAEAVFPQGCKLEVAQTWFPDTASQEVTCWGTWEIWRPLFQKQVNLLNVSNPYTRKCAHLEPLDCIMEVRQSLVLMEMGMLEPFCSCRKKSQKDTFKGIFPKN